MGPKRYKHTGESSYTLGMALTLELLLSKPECAEQVYLSTAAEDNQALRQLKFLCEKQGIPAEYNEKAFKILSPKGNCYVIGVFRKFACELEPASAHVVLVNPSDAGNLGTILRTAAGFDLPDIAIIRPAVDIFDPKVVRASMGAIFKTRFCYFEDFVGYAEEYPRNFYAFMLHEKSKPIEQVVFNAPCALIFGNEGSGLPDSFADLDLVCPVVIPHTANIDSLNLPIAAGIAMFQATKSKMASYGCGK